MTSEFARIAWAGKIIKSKKEKRRNLCVEEKDYFFGLGFLFCFSSLLKAVILNQKIIFFLKHINLLPSPLHSSLSPLPTQCRQIHWSIITLFKTVLVSFSI